MRTAAKRGVARWLTQNCGYIFLFGVFVAFSQAGLFAGHSHPEVHVYPDASETEGNWLPATSDLLPFTDTRPKPVITEHPIPKLMQDAEGQFRKKLGGQSKTLQAAVKEYKRRYQRDPPKGFGDWWKFARDHDVKMVDEYDGLVEDLAPFWRLSGEELRRRALQVRSIHILLDITHVHFT